MSQFGGFPIEVIEELRIPGLPERHELVLADAERAGAGIPDYSSGEIARFFFQHHVTWLRKKLATIEHPPLAHRFYYSELRHGKLSRDEEVQKWSLGEVERMACWFFELGVIDQKKYVVARQLVAWIARGHGIYHG